MLTDKHMPTGPRGQKRLADVISDAVHVMALATGETEEKLTENGKNAAAVALGRKGGRARAKAIPKAERRKIALMAAKARWAGKKR